MPRPTVLVIDVGTTVIKTSLFDFTCRSIDRVSCPHQCAGLNLGVPVERWWTIIAESAALLASRNPGCQIAAIGVTGFMHSVIALDAEGRPFPFSPEIGSTRRFFNMMLGDFGVKKIYRTTGSRLDVTSVPPQILAWREHNPADFSRIATIVPVKDFIRFRMTGAIATDEIDACGTMFYDVHRRRWDPGLLAYCGLEEKNLPCVLHCTQQAGKITSKAAEELGLPEATPVAVGGGDDIEIVGSGACSPKELCEHVGSTGSFLLPLKSSRTDPAYRLELYPAIAREEWVLGGSCSNVTRALDWFLASSIYNSSGTIRWDRVRSDMGQALTRIGANRPLFVPYLQGERAPVWNPDLTGAWIGLRSCHTAADLLLAVVEGICFSLRSLLDAYDDLGLDIALVHSSGGLNQLDTQKLRASLYGKPIQMVRGVDPTSFATAAITLCSIGELGDPRDAVAWLDSEPDVEPEAEWRNVLNDRFLLFAEHVRRLSSKAGHPSSRLRVGDTR